MMMEALQSSETSVLTRATLHKIPEDGILHTRSYHRDKLRSCRVPWRLCGRNREEKGTDVEGG
jgi:hypothetical protein